MPIYLFKLVNIFRDHQRVAKLDSITHLGPVGRSEPLLNGGSQTGTETVVLGGRPAMAPTPIVGAASNELSELAAGGSGANGTRTITASSSKSEKPASSSAASKLHRTFNQHCNQVKEIDLVVRFEILIVKMTLLPGISGLQFCRILGNAGQYQTFGDLSLSDPPSFLL
ncbi:hypothetical protein PTTG_25735 [Puccinia triticina 1-1 BBBD Race 1]|uniref:KA1 domain-containing protein n=1 Tax=Puccinia triticina (isolate 1-1 / race 1 (BBBD)) TaxID=630390 RepID=A0A180H112_PUCT1|nr:hypothetical protein PTTG_25735 [Puccinia triticina 1-1 BBBD Race 1]